MFLLRTFLLATLAAHGLGKDVRYYLAAVEVQWSYSETGDDLIKSSLTPVDERNISTALYRKVVFREYVDGTFTTPSPRESYLGIQGPTLRANVGDRLLVMFKNMATHPHSIHPQGLVYDKNNEGSRYPDALGVGGALVNPGDDFTYTWRVTPETGPTTNDGDCVTSLYYSDVDMTRDVHSGLVGQVVICKTGKPVSVTDERKYALLFSTFDETLSHYNNSGGESSLFRTINGFSFGHLPTLEVCVGDNVMLHFTSLGGSDDVRTITLYGHSLLFKEKRLSSIPLYPGAGRTVTFQAHSEGRWLLTSQHPLEMNNGMQGVVRAVRCKQSGPVIDVSGRFRRFYIAAEYAEWNDGRLAFFGYTDDTFSKRITEANRGDYMGILGPLLTVETGDIIKVVFFNRADRPLSMHPHGLRVGKPYEGVLYNDSENGKNAVLPMNIKTYYWWVPEFVSPAPRDEPCLPRYYVSGTGNGPDTDLIGPILLCRRNTLDQNGQPFNSKNIFMVFKSKDTCQEINGFSDASKIISPEFCAGDTASLHIMGVAYSTPQSLTVTGNRITRGGSVKGVTELLVGYQSTVTLHASNTGIWLIHITASKDVQMKYRVKPCTSVRPPEVFRPSDSYTVNLGIEETGRPWDYLEGANKTAWERDLKISTTPTSAYKKVFYRKFYRDDFGFAIPWQKYLGPLFVEKAGTSVNIELKNLARRTFSVDIMGITSGNTTLTSGSQKRVQWNIPSAEVPGTADPPCIIKLYTSTVNEVRDRFSGLMGPLVVCHSNMTNLDLLNEDRHLLFFVGVVDESDSWYRDENIERYKAANDTDLDDPEISRVNSFHVLNGVSNIPVDTKRIVRNSDVFLHFYNIGYKFHTLHFHGNMLSDSASDYVDRGTIALYPGDSRSVKVRMQNPGDWLIEEFTTMPHHTRFYGKYSIPDDGSGVAN